MIQNARHNCKNYRREVFNSYEYFGVQRVLIWISSLAIKNKFTSWFFGVYVTKSYSNIAK